MLTATEAFKLSEQGAKDCIRDNKAFVERIWPQVEENICKACRLGERKADYVVGRITDAQIISFAAFGKELGFNLTLSCDRVTLRITW